MIRLFYPSIHVELTLNELQTPLATRYVGEGPQVKRLEQAFATLTYSPRTPVAVNSGTSALELALHLAGVRHGSGAEVITTPMTCLATNAAIIQRGGTLVWADVDPRTGLIDPADVACLVGPKTAAIVAVDWGGRSCDYAKLKAHGLPVIQDAAHNLIPQPERGDYVCWSLQAIKHLTAGDGGMLLCPDEATTTRAKRLRWYGYDRDSGADFRCEQDVDELGWKWQMNDLAASVALANLPYVPHNIARQQTNARYYDSALRGLHGVEVPPYDPASPYWLYTLLVRDRPSFQAFLAEREIETSRAHRRNDDYAALGGPAVPGVLPGTDRFDDRQVNVPVGWWLGDAERHAVVEAVIAWSRHQGGPQ